MSSNSTLATRVVEGAKARLELESAEIKVQSGPDRGLSYTLSTDSILIGSSPSCELALGDRTVSARHAEVSLSERGYLIRDLGSTNGIWASGIAIERALLSDGMQLQLGDTTLLVCSKKERRSVALSAPGRLGSLVTCSLKMRALAAALESLAKTDTTVLLQGETGSGKERVAEALHQISTRKGGPFVVFDCGAVSAELVAAELFGHEKGAFTGADRARPGIFAEAEGGTLLLDEIGELRLDVQPILLRAIERRTTRSIGSRSEKRHDVRIAAATNRNLAAEVKAGRFRADLYHRLAVARLVVPPLRERREDIPVLAEEFANEARLTLARELRLSFEAYDWPGNVRELRNTILRLASRPSTPTEAVGSVAEALSICDAQGNLLQLPDLRHELERRYVALAIERAQGNLAKAAELAGLARQSFSALAEKLGLHKRTPRG